MSKDPFEGFPNSGGAQGTKRAGCGGDMTGCTKDVNKYRPPVGPSNINDSKSPGLHGTNHGNSGTQGRR